MRNRGEVLLRNTYTRTRPYYPYLIRKRNMDYFSHDDPLVCNQL